MRKKNQMIGVLCAIAMAASSLMGCGGSSGSTEAESSAAASVEAETETAAAEETAGGETGESAQAAGEPVEELPIATADNPITLKVAMPVNSKVEDINTNQLTLYIEEQTGIDLEFIELSDSETATQINTLMNGGDLPDVFIGYSFPYDTLCSYADAGLLQPLDEYIDKWGYNLKNTILADPDLEKALNYVSYDGHVYAMPSGGGLITNVYGHWVPRIQTYFLDELGMELPETLDDLKAFLQKVKENYPDVIPMTAYANENYIFGNISQAFQFTDITTYLKLSDGKVEFIGNNEEFRKALEYTKEMVDEGLIDPAAFTQDKSVLATQVAQDGYNVAVLCSGYMIAQVYDTGSEEYNDFKLLGSMEGPDGYRSTQTDHKAASVQRAMVITSACQYPEEAFRLFDFFLSDDFALKARVGFEGEQWEKAADGVVGRDGEQAWFITTTIPMEWQKPSTNVIWDSENFTHCNILNHCEVAEVGKKYPTAAEIVGQNLMELDSGEEIPTFIMSSEDMTEYNELKDLIVDNVSSNISQFVLGNRDLSEFDDYCAELDSMGVDRYVELAQMAYDSLQ
ncbi:MAG TPA: extracellular solute-binding protein [Candidatus Eisenbergiella stercoravium]|nr:extracellular solute-binding protein [Candidatus Eisenbergiella stercoravium]